jgi:transaldolase
MPSVNDLGIKIFADGADLSGMLKLYDNPWIKGFTTNPTLMHKAGISDYAAFAEDVLQAIRDRPVSLEVFADEFDEMDEQAREIASWGANVNVKIPITNTRGDSAVPLIADLSASGVQVNVTAVMTLDQVRDVAEALDPATSAIVSVFAGRIADTGRDPIPVMKEALTVMKDRPRAELLWASPREILNIFQADAIGCHIITVTHDMLAKLSSVDKDLDQFSLETVKMFHRDALAAGFSIDKPRRQAIAG